MIDQAPHLRRGQLPPFRDPCHQLATQCVQQRVELLAARSRQLAVGQGLHGRLELGATQDLEPDAQAGQQVAGQRHLHREPGQPDQAYRLQIDLVEGGGEIVALVARAELAETVGRGNRELAAGPEALDRIAQFLGRAQAVGCLGQAHQQTADARVCSGGVQGQHDVGDGRAAAAARD